jgi:signal transduction histidine kinase
VLPRMVRMLAQGTGATHAQVWLRVGDDVVPAASFPESNGSSATSSGSMVDRSELHGAFPVVHQGTPIGTVTVEMTPSDPLTPPKQKLIEDFAAQAGHVLRNVQLVEELRASRVRLVAAQDHERRALERNIHDGAQQQLVALAVKTKLAMTVAQRDGAVRTAAALEDVRTGAQLALEELRDVARGIYPPLLADQGLGVALEAQARKSSLATTVDQDGVGRHPQQVEAAVYFCALEALQNASAHGRATRAAVRLHEDGGEIRFEVQDDGRGFDPAATSGSGLQAMADRLDALGGSLTVRSAPGAGTTVIGRVPVNVQGSTA